MAKKKPVPAPENLDSNMSREQTYKNTVKAYQYSWDSFSEPIQNSIKSITERMKQDNTFTSGHVDIHVNRKDRLIRVKDNGTGFNPGSLGHGASGWKKKKPEAGYGLGLTALSLQSSEITVQSRTMEKQAHRREGRDFYKIPFSKKVWTFLTN